MEFYNIDDDDILLVGIMRNPVLFIEFLYYLEEFYENEKADPDKSFRLFEYQKDFLCDFNTYVSFRAARSAGKTTSLKSKIIWLLLNAAYGKNAILFTVPSQAHLEPVWDSVVKLIRTNPLAKHFMLGKNRGINASANTIDLRTPTRFIARIAGIEGGGRNVIGLHVPAIFVDEAGFYPWSTFQELQPVLNKHDKGKQLIVAGTPSGEREKNVLYFADQISDIYSRHRVKAFDNPFYTEKDHQEDIKKYGGKDSPDYIHFVLGEHGAPVYSLFDRNLMLISKYPVYKIVFNLAKKDVDEKDLDMRIRQLPSMEREYKTFIGIDLGYSDPTAIYIIYDKDGYFRIHAKVKLIRVPYPLQREVIKYLDTKYSPEWIAIDVGHAGINFYQDLIKDEDRNFDKKIIPVNFASSVPVGIDERGKEIKQNVKELSVKSLQDIIMDRRIEFSTTDIETIDDLEKLTYTKTPSGKFIYRMAGRSQSRQNDHFVSALLCFSYGVFVNSYGIYDKGKNNRRIRSLFSARLV